MSNRLESLNPKKPAAKPGLKFKPKAVARKSKEDRDRELSEVKTEPSLRQNSSDRGRGSSRGRGRGRGGAYAGTHVVSAGPLAMGSVTVGNGTTSTKTGLTADRIYTSGESSSTVSVTGLKLKSQSSSVKKNDVVGAENDSESDDEQRTRINMNKDYAFEDSETVLFPVRPQKYTGATSEPESANERTQSPETDSKTPSRAVTVESIKSEDVDGVKPAEFSEPTSGVPLLVNPDEKQEADEHDRILDDQKTIIDMLTSDLDSMKTDDAESGDSENGKYVLIHVPQITLSEPPKADIQPSRSHFASPVTQDFEGQVGSLNFHQSGKITMSIGSKGTVFLCAGGNPSSFLQELYVIEDHEALKTAEELAEGDENGSVLDAEGRKLAGRIHRLGNISGKIVATPAIL